MPNGNELANVLRWPKGKEYEYSWYAGQQLPEEWWKSDFPYGEAERMGYQLSPEETKKFYERKKKEKEKTLSEELADILKRPEVKMLTAPERADLIDKIAKAQGVIATREEAREKHEAEMLEIGRQTQMQDRVKAILQSDRVPAQKVTALTMAGIPLGDARDMVWGKRGAEGEAKTPSRGAGAAPSPEGRAPTGASARRISGYVSAAETGAYSPAELMAALVGEGIDSEAAQAIASVAPQAAAAERAEYRIDDAIAAKDRERRDSVEEARILRNEAIYEKRRGNIAEATKLENEAKKEEEKARQLKIDKIELEGEALRKERVAKEEKRLGEVGEYYKGVREAVRPPTEAETLALETTRTAAKRAEDARLQAKFAPGEALRKEKQAIEDARIAKNAAIYADRRGATLEALQNRLKEANAELEARYAKADYVTSLGTEMSDKNKAEEKARLDKEAEYWQGTRDSIKEKMKEEADKEERLAKERQVKIDQIEAKGEARQTAKEKKEKERLEKLQEQGETTRKNIKEATEKDEQQEKDELEARYAKAKEVREIGEALANKRYQAKLDKAEYDAEQRKIARLETKEDRVFAQTILDKSMNWITTFRNLGFDHDDFVKAVPKFLRILGVNRSQEQEIANALGLMFKKSEETEKKTIKEFEGSLSEQTSAIDKRVKIEGMTPDLENQIEMMALLYVMLEEKKLGEGNGLAKWSSFLGKEGWFFTSAENPFKTRAASDLFLKELPNAIHRVKTGNLMSAAVGLLGDQAGKMVAAIGKPGKEPIKIDLPNGLVTACTPFSDGEKNECYETYRTLFNTKGVMTEPAMGDRNRAMAFVIGKTKDETRKKKELPVNFNDSDYVKAVLKATTLSKKQKAWLFWKQFTPIHREGMRNQAGMLGNLIIEGKEEGTGIWGWIKRGLKRAIVEPFYDWGKKEPEKTESTGNIREDVNAFLGEHGMDQTPEGIREFLRGLGWKDDQINTLGIK